MRHYFFTQSHPSERDAILAFQAEVTHPQTSVPVISKWGNLRQKLFGIDPKETTFVQRGFRPGNVQAQQQLEHIGYTFLQGYHAALADHKPDTLALRLNTIEAEWRGFAFEGAAMGLALLDALTPWQQNRLAKFMAGPGAAHIYMVHVGAGWILARLPWRRPVYLTQLNCRANAQSKIQNAKAIDPLLGWLAIDGYGFHEGYFNWPRSVEQKTIPKKLSGYARRVFDQGLGRSLWFVCGADCSHIPRKISTFDAKRHADLWSGVGLACAYAGGVDPAAIEALKSAAGKYQPHLAQGAAFAAKARQKAGNPTAHTEIACQILCGMGAGAAAEVTDQALENLPPVSSPQIGLEGKQEGAEPAYEIWKQRIQSHFSREMKP
ncbi:DUF1702 family protein [Moorena sp. SIOASIH]|uniref:DUF1702 family protein n=1 Tax=Moorena sp. SIOASIH TaxID=2607817 RepID=UPI0025D0FD47|nr:DUF1702 family protein [Moorena sp. SIOASIH]